MINYYFANKVAFALVLTCLSQPAFAHHSHASLNRDDQRTMSGVVSNYSWRSPHVYLQVDVVDQAGERVEYTIEMNNPMSMGRAGWSKTSWAVGDRITWFGSHDRDSDRHYMGLTWAEKDGGTRMYTTAVAQKRYLEREGKDVPAFLDNSATPVPATAVGEGTWSRIAFDGGRFKNIYTPEPIMDWPLTAKARAQVDTFTEADNPLTRCIINGPPRAMLTLPNFKWSRPDDRTILIDRDLFPQPRVIHLDRTLEAEGPTPFGHSVGWFENGVLHVKSNNFTGEPWGLFWGLDSSPELELEERYWLSKGGMRLNLEMTISDPLMLTRPVTWTHQWQKIADTDIIHAECSLENANFFTTAGYN